MSGARDGARAGARRRARRATPAVRFGTSGWRGVLGDDFTFAGVRAAVRAVAEWVGEEVPSPRVLVAHDTRFLGERLAEEAARVLAGAGVRVVTPGGPLPTPLASFAVRRGRAHAGLVFTASHNPPEYQGLKVIAAWGGAAPVGLTRRFERVAAAWLDGPAPPTAEPRTRTADLHGPYERALRAHLDLETLARGRPGVVYDALHGVGAGVLDGVLARCGARVDCRRAEPDPRFGGAPPDPVPARLAPLAAALRRRPGWLGLATDGDADRFAVVDRGGRLVSESDAVALLVDHLARTGRIHRGVALSRATGTLAERVARAHGLAVSRHPIGFKYLTAALLDGTADVAGEESGGFAWAPVARDKDGILAGCLVAEVAASSGGPLRGRLAELRRRLGGGVSGRTAVRLPVPAAGVLRGLRRALPRRLDGARVLDVDAGDGLHVGLADGFLMWRGSGTEPVLRVYAEAPDARSLERRLAAGVRRLRREAAASRSG